MFYEEKSYASKKEILTYGIANGGQVFGYGLVASYLSYFYINVFQIDPKIVSAVFFIGGIWDILNNPLMGMVIDRKTDKNGRLTYFLKRFAPPLGLATILIFAAPYILPDALPTSPIKIVYFVVSYLLWEMLYTVTDVAFGGLSAAFSPSPADRQKAITASNICQMVSSAAVFTAIPMMLDLTAKGKIQIGMREVFFIMGLFAGIIGVGLFSLSGFVIKERVRQTEKQSSLKEMLKAVTQNRPLLLLLCSNLIAMFGMVGNAMSTYYYIDVLGYASLSILVGAPPMAIGFASYAILARLKNGLTINSFCCPPNSSFRAFSL